MTIRRTILSTLTVAVLAVAGMTGPAHAAAPASMSPCPQSGQRVKGSSSTIYLVDPRGYYDIIPNTVVYFDLWGSWSGIVTLPDVTLANCEKAPLKLTQGYLFGDANTGKIYIYDGTVGGYRWIVNMSIFNKYEFDISKVVWGFSPPTPTYSPDWDN